MSTPAQLQQTASPEWAALRLWAAGVRDNLNHDEDTRADSEALIALLDQHHDMRCRHPMLANELWKTALALANKMAQPGEWRQGPPRS
jgi:hypothetical protein